MKKMPKQLTHKNLFKLINEEISKKINFNPNESIEGHFTKSSSYQVGLSGVSRVEAVTADVITTVQTLLRSALPDKIIDGLVVTETDPVSNKVNVTPGSGNVAGELFELSADVEVEIPFDESTSVFFLHLYQDRIIVDRAQYSDRLTIAKIVVPSPGTTSRVIDKRDDSLDAYIVNLRTVTLYEDGNGNLEEDSLDLIKDNITPLLAETLTGTLTLDEGLTITNVQGSLEIDSEEIRIIDVDGNTLSKFNTLGTFFYDSDGVEVAKFGKSEARIGNIIITDSSIESGDFVSGLLGKGFQINDSGDIEANNISLRGKLKSAVFEYSTVSGTSGSILVSKSADKLAQDMTATGTVMYTDGSVTFSVGDILWLKSSSSQMEYMTVSAVTSSTQYTVTRDSGGSGAVAWQKGVAIMNLGQSGDGGVYITADDTNAPYFDIYTHSGSPWSGFDTKVRLGNLNGFLGESSDVYGLAIGETAKYLKYDPTNGLRLKGSSIDACGTAFSGARVSILPDSTTGLVVYDDSGNKVFETIVGGADVGDVIIGDETTGTAYVKFDKSTGILTVRGTLSGQDITAETISSSKIISCPWGKITGGTIESQELILGSGGIFRSSNYDDGTTETTETDTKLLLHFDGTDEATSTTDDSSSGHSVTFAGTAQLDTAEEYFGSSSLLLNGNSDYVYCDDSADWDWTDTNKTLHLFVKHDDHAGTEVYIMQYEDDDNFWRLRHIDGTGIHFAISTANSSVVDFYGSEITDTNWHHVALCKVGDEYGIYLDGTQVGYVNDNSIDTFTGELLIGAWGGATASYFDGWIDEVHFINTNYFSADPGSVDSDTKLLLNFEGDDAATSTTDRSLSVHSMTFEGTAQIDTAAYKFGSSSLLLDGNSDYITASDDSEWDWNITNKTVDFFVKFVDHAGTEYLISQHESVGNQWAIKHVHGSGLSFDLVKSSSSEADTGYGGEITDTDWHHVAVIKVGTDIGLYVDGSQVAYDSATISSTLTGNLCIGCREKATPESYFDGHIDCVRISNSNHFNANPSLSGLTDTITVPTSAYSIFSDTITVPTSAYSITSYSTKAGFRLDATNGLEINTGAVNADIVLIEGARLRDQFTITEQSTTEDRDSGKWDQGTKSNVSVTNDELHLTYGQTSGTFTSQALDCGVDADYGIIRWTEFIPDGSLDLVTNYGSYSSYTSGGGGDANNGTQENPADDDDATRVNWGNGTVFWGENPIWEVDLGEARWVNKCIVVNYSTYNIDWRLQYSDDGGVGGSWTNAFSDQTDTSQEAETEQTQSFTPGKHRYWRWISQAYAQYYDGHQLATMKLYAYAENPDLTVQVRTDDNSGMTSPTDWSSKYTNPSGVEIDVTNQRYIQYRVNYTVDNATDCHPSITSITVNCDDVVVTNSDKLDGYDASQTAAADTIPVADGDGLIDDWVSASNMIAHYTSGCEVYSSGNYGMYIGTSITNDASSLSYMYFTVDGNTYRTFCNFKFLKKVGINTITIYARIWDSGNGAASIEVDIGASSGDVTRDATTPGWATVDTIDVSGLSDGTVYDGAMKLKNTQLNGEAFVSEVILLAS